MAALEAVDHPVERRAVLADYLRALAVRSARVIERHERQRRGDDRGPTDQRDDQTLLGCCSKQLPDCGSHPATSQAIPIAAAAASASAAST